MVLCAKCGTAQLDYTVPKETMFADHTYLSGMTKTLSDHFRGVAEKADRRFFANRPGNAMLDIGSNDGTQLRHYMVSSATTSSASSRASSSPPSSANAAGLPTLRAFFNAEVARSLGRKFQVINASGVFFHLEELHSVTDGIRESLAPDGVFLIQFLYMKRIVENDAFDQIYHEHLLYYNVRHHRHASCGGTGWRSSTADLAPIHGGSIIAYATHAEKAKPSAALEAFGMREDEGASGCNALPWYHAFTERIALRKKGEPRLLAAPPRTKGKKVFGLGAPVKGNTLLNYYGIGPELIECLVEKNQHRRGLVAPGSHIPLVIEDELKEPPDIYYVLAWNFKRRSSPATRISSPAGSSSTSPSNPKEG